MPASDARLGLEPVRRRQLLRDALGLAGRLLAAREQEHPRAVARDDHALAEPLARLVVQVERAQPVAQRQAVALVLQLHLDSPLVAHGTKVFHAETGHHGPGSIGLDVRRRMDREMKPVTTSAAAQSAVASTEARTLQNYVGGAWQPASVAETLEDRDPVSGEIDALIPLSGATGAAAAAAAARGAQAEGRGVPPQRGAGAIMRLRSELTDRGEELARLVTEDMGKTLDDARG